jgi:ubiquinone/menaquinone biosynthesis C-methylase UbiE
MEAEKERVREFWDSAPCGTRDTEDLDEIDQHLELERMRDAREPFIPAFARFEEARGKEILEVGVGAGTDHLRFARSGAICSGVDLTQAAVDLTSRRLAQEGLTSKLRVADAEALPFEDDSFDTVYSWGVIHHTPDVPRAAGELLRVLRPGGRFCVMVYNVRSLVALQTWARFSLLKGAPSTSFKDAVAENMESPGTQAYTAQEALQLFPVESATVETVITAYDLRLGRRLFLPRWTWNLVPSSLGWFHVVSGFK